MVLEAPARSQESSAKISPDFAAYLFERHPLPGFIYDPETLKYLAVNVAAVERYGYSQAEFRDMTLADIRPPEDIPSMLESVRQRTDSPPGGYWRHRLKGGAVVSVNTHAFDVICDGRSARMVLVTDFFERETLEENLRLFASAAEAAKEAIVITSADFEHRIVYANPAFVSMTGCGLVELAGSELSTQQAASAERITRERIVADLNKSGAAIYETVFSRKDGEEYQVEWQVSPIRDSGGNITHHLNLQRDVTERNRLQEQFQQAQKMEAVGRLAGGIAHDFNNLLTIILGYANLMNTELTRNPQLNARALSNLKEIHDAAEKAAALTSQLLAFSRKQVQRTRALELNPVITKVEAMLRRLIGEDIDLELHLDGELGIVQADPGQVEQVLMNLAVNARDAMPDGGLLTIETRNVEITGRTAAATSIKPGSYVMISVTDTGHGMDSATRRRVFEPFFTTKEAGRGTGLGLAMVYSFLNQIGGTVSVYSEPDRGACFKLYLPRIDAATGTSSERLASEVSRGSGVVLVVEDERGIRDLIEQILLEAGYVVITASNAEEALAHSEKAGVAIDLLFSDVVLPGVSGPDLAAKLKALNPNLRVLLASGYSDHALFRHGTLERGVNFIQKPFETDALVARITEILRAGRMQGRVA